MNTRAYLGGALLMLLMSSAAAQSYDLSDHTLAGSSVKTYHVKCQDGGFGLIRQTTDTQHGTQFCLNMQTGINQQHCLPISQRKAADVLAQLAKKACV